MAGFKLNIYFSKLTLAEAIFLASTVLPQNKLTQSPNEPTPPYNKLTLSETNQHNLKPIDTSPKQTNMVYLQPTQPQNQLTQPLSQRTQP